MAAIDITRRMKGKIPKAVGWRIIILVDEVKETISEGSKIIIPETSRDGLQQAEIFGVVFDVGPMAYANPSHGLAWCEVGDTVQFARHAGEAWIIDGKTYRVVNDEDVVVVFIDKEKLKLVKNEEIQNERLKTA